MFDGARSVASRIQSLAAHLGLSALIVTLFFLLFEGFSSYLLVVRKAIEPEVPLAERRHTKYDSQLGWVNIPNVYIRDMYGPGVYLRTNSQGFRNDSEFQTQIPPGKLRLICSGDSFTLGYGVSNGDTWCQDLVSLDSRFETVNMGQGGYGLDQAYLWYARDGIALDHDVQIFAFIGTDLTRMVSVTFNGYPKPTLGLRDSQLVVQNVPVPQLGPSTRFVQQFDRLRELRSIILLQRILFRKPAAWSNGGPGGSPVVLAIAETIFDRLADLNRKKNSKLIVLFLPTQGEYRNGLPSHVEQIKSKVIAKGIMWIDLVDDFRKLPPTRAERLFIGEDALSGYRTAAGHYTVEGNRYVAEILYSHIASIPSVALRLAAVAKSGSQRPLRISEAN